MNILEPNRFGALSEETLARFEWRFSLRLPDDYRAFLLACNGGRPGPENTIDFTDDQGANASSVSLFYGIHGGEEWGRLDVVIETFEGRVPHEAIPIACDPFGNQYLMIVSGERKGAVYFWDHERETDPPGYANMYALGRSFTEFAESLHQDVPSGEPEEDRIIRENDLDALSTLLDSGRDVESEDDYGRTLIENAAIHNRTEMIQLLFDRGARLRNALGLARENHRFFAEHKASVDLLEKLSRERND